MRAQVEIHPRRHMTEREKLQRWEECGQACMICRMPVLYSGPSVIWDHRVPLAIGGTNDLSNMEPHHAGPCAKMKTALDAKARAKVKRIIKREADGPKPSRLQSRGFQKTLRKKLNGTVVRR